MTSRDKTLLPYNMEGFKGIDIACMTRGVSQGDLFRGQKSKSTNIYDSVILFSYLCYRGVTCFIYIRVLHDIHEIWCSCCLTIKRWVSLVEQELLAFPKHMIPFPVFSGVRVAQSYVFFVVFCISLFVLFSFFIYLWHCISFLDVRLLVTSNFPNSHEYHYLI